jgi:hypothetical protein
MFRACAVAFVMCLGMVGCSAGLTDEEKAANDPNRIKPLLRDRTAKVRDDAEPRADQTAALAALEVTRADGKKLSDSLTIESKPTDLKKALEVYLEALEKCDVTASPAEFRTAWKKYVKANRELTESIRRQPDTFEDIEFMTNILALFSNQAEKGKTLGGDITASIRAVVRAHNELYAAAEKGSLEVSK